MADELKAVALTAPTSGDPRTEREWARVEKYAGLPSIEAHLRTARRARDRAQRAVDRWEALLAVRTAQVEAGEWPPKVERVTWEELQAGDVLRDDPDRETLVEDVKTEHGWTTIHYRVNGTLHWQAKPAGRETTIKPRTEEAP